MRTRYELQKAVLVKSVVCCCLVFDSVCFCRYLVTFYNNPEPPSVSRRWKQRFFYEIFSWFCWAETVCFLWWPKRMHDFRFPLRRKWDLRSSRILRSVQWKLGTDVLRPTVGLIWKFRAVEEEDENDRLSRKNRNGIAILHCVKSQKNADLVLKAEFLY